MSLEALKLRESATVQPGVFNDDGTVNMILLRPCVGRGKGRHLYTRDMLRENAHKFAGWKMYLDHQSEAARKAAGGLPRSVRDLGGRVVEATWDETVPAEGRFESGAVVGKVRPVKLVRELIEDDPDLVEASINARATGVRPVTRDGQKVWLVEGIEDTGSVDWVTEAGAGARVVSLMESVYDGDEAEEMALLETLTDEEFAAHMRSERPGLMESITGAAVKDDEDTNPGGTADPNTEVGEDDMSIESLREALSSEEGREMLREAGVLLADDINDQVTDLVESRLAEERDIIFAEAQASAQREIRLRDMRDAAHRLIEGARLPGTFADDLKSKFTLTEAGPTEGLDVIDEVDDEGNLVRPAEDILRESVEAGIAHQRDLIAAANPTRVRGQGPSNTGDGGSDANKKSDPEPLWKRTLQEAGVDVDTAYQG